jgi:hypothetical protein
MKIPHNIGRLEALSDRQFAIFVALAAVSMLVAYLGIGVRYGIPGFIYAFLGPLCYMHAARFQKKYPKLL